MRWFVDLESVTISERASWWLFGSRKALATRLRNNLQPTDPGDFLRVATREPLQ